MNSKDYTNQLEEGKLQLNQTKQLLFLNMKLHRMKEMMQKTDKLWQTTQKNQKNI